MDQEMELGWRKFLLLGWHNPSIAQVRQGRSLFIQLVYMFPEIICPTGELMAGGVPPFDNGPPRAPTLQTPLMALTKRAGIVLDEPSDRCLLCSRQGGRRVMLRFFFQEVVFNGT